MSSMAGSWWPGLRGFSNERPKHGTYLFTMSLSPGKYNVDMLFTGLLDLVISAHATKNLLIECASATL